ncbi:hypothetical protein ACIRD9_10195 [Streptomyces violaceus]
MDRPAETATAAVGWPACGFRHLTLAAVAAPRVVPAEAAAAE